MDILTAKRKFNYPENAIWIDGVDIDINWFQIKLLLVKWVKNTLLVTAMGI